MKLSTWARCVLLAVLLPAGPVIAAADDEALALLKAAQSDAALGRNAAAVQKLEKALALRTSTNLARALADDGRPAEAMRTLPGLTAELRRLPASRDKAYGLVSVGRLYVRLGDRAVGASLLNEALASAEAANDARARSSALGYLAEVYEQGGRTRDALQLSQRAIVAADEANAPELLFRWQWHKARLLKRQGDSEESILAYQHAVQTLSTVRADL